MKLREDTWSKQERSSEVLLITATTNPHPAAVYIADDIPILALLWPCYSEYIGSSVNCSTLPHMQAYIIPRFIVQFSQQVARLFFH